ncbi:DUF485 domain-containing protein [Paremcibacter congregatus]|jgi:uncharacterized membrane protein (DUF485 family)|uniref:DUF485 domain-containing protein n=1 Tax=Paremcibacter congregatus TaxID=2043170 RepID=UPI0030ECC172|tara:strand:+ start:658 stop:972 length:315 start_codon:yes stop_codon:yes gene_type:complete
MSQDPTARCLQHPKFKQLVHARGRFSLIFTLVILGGYSLYVLGMSFAPAFMAAPFRDGGHVTNGIVLAILVILNGMVCAGIYSWWANRRFDAIRKELREDLGHV